jgi:hypothetical protein
MNFPASAMSNPVCMWGGCVRQASTSHRVRGWPLQQESVGRLSLTRCSPSAPLLPPARNGVDMCPLWWRDKSSRCVCVLGGGGLPDRHHLTQQPLHSGAWLPRNLTPACDIAHMGTFAMFQERRARRVTKMTWVWSWKVSTTRRVLPMQGVCTHTHLPLP